MADKEHKPVCVHCGELFMCKRHVPCLAEMCLCEACDENPRRVQRHACDDPGKKITALRAQARTIVDAVTSLGAAIDIAREHNMPLSQFLRLVRAAWNARPTMPASNASGGCPGSGEHVWETLTRTEFFGCWYCKRFAFASFTCEHGGSRAVRWCTWCGAYVIEPEPKA